MFFFIAQVDLPSFSGETILTTSKAEVILGAGDDAAVVDFIEQKTRISTVQTLDRWGFCWEVFNGRRSNFFNEKYEKYPETNSKFAPKIDGLPSSESPGPYFQGRTENGKAMCFFLKMLMRFFLGAMPGRKCCFSYKASSKKLGATR